MAEIAGLILALICLAADSTSGAILFTIVSIASAGWRSYKAREAAQNSQTEVETLRADLERVTSMAERAMRAASELSVELQNMRKAGAKVPATAAPSEAAAHVKAQAIVPLATTKSVEKEPEVAPGWSMAANAAATVAPSLPPDPKPPAAAPALPVQAPPRSVQEPPVASSPRVTPSQAPRPASAPAAPHVPSFQTIHGQPRKSLAERLRSALALEEILGTNWLNKLGVIIFVLGIALFGIYELGQLGPAGKVGFSATVSLALLGGGIYLERKERYRILGRTGIGGGWALLFFTSYALNHVAAMRVVSSDLAGAIVMLVVAGAMVAHTLRYRSQLVTGLAFLLAYSTIALSHDTVYSLAAGAILATAVVFIVVKLGWYELEIFAILSSYGNHFYWLYRLLGADGAKGHVFPEFIASSSLLLFYWAAFRTSYVVRKIESAAEERLSTISALLNTVLLLAVMKFQSARPELAFYALLVLGMVEFAIGQLPIARRRRAAFVVLTLMGTALMIAAVPFRYSGHSVSILWLTGAEILLFAGVLTGERLFRRIGLATGLIVLAHVLLAELPRMIAIRQSAPDLPLTKEGVLLCVMGGIFYANVAGLRLRWRQLFEEGFDNALLTATSYPGCVTLGVACWAAFTHDGMAVALGVAMIGVAAVALLLKSRHVQTQIPALGLAAAVRGVAYNTHWDMPAHSSARIFSLIALGALFYFAAKLAQHRDDAEQRAFRDVLAAAGTCFIAVLLYVEVPAKWQPTAFGVLALGLIEAARWTKYAVLRWHTHAVALCSLVLAAKFDIAGTASWRIVQVGILWPLPVVLAMYALAGHVRHFTDETTEWVPSAYSWAGSSLAVWLFYESFEQHYVAAAWALFAVLLTIVSRWRTWKSPAMQALIIGALAAIQAGVVNLLGTAPGNHGGVRLIVCLVVIASLYLMSEVLRLPEIWRQQQIEALHSWLATAIAAMLMWYELSPVAVALGWALFGLTLYEYGAIRRLGQLRWQAQLVLLASFARIFFANLNAESTGSLFSAQLLTVVPIAAIYYFVYARGLASSSNSRIKPGPIFAYLGTAAVMALVYFQFAGEWVITAWAAMTMLLLACALLFNREVFAQQCVLLAVAVLSRGVVHNLFGGSYFSGSDWRGRFAVVGSAVLLLLASLPLAFEYQRRSPVDSTAIGVRRMLGLVVHHVEQPLFFVAVTLLTTMLALKMDHGMVTLAWGIEAVLIFVGALLAKERSFRLTGVLLLLLCVAKIIFVDAWRLAPRDRYLTFIVLGASLLLVSFLYSKYRETIRQYL